MVTTAGETILTMSAYESRDAATSRTALPLPDAAEETVDVDPRGRAAALRHIAPAPISIPATRTASVRRTSGRIFTPVCSMIQAPPNQRAGFSPLYFN